MSGAELGISVPVTRPSETGRRRGCFGKTGGTDSGAKSSVGDTCPGAGTRRLGQVMTRGVRTLGPSTAEVTWDTPRVYLETSRPWDSSAQSVGPEARGPGPTWPPEVL